MIFAVVFLQMAKRSLSRYNNSDVTPNLILVLQLQQEMAISNNSPCIWLQSENRIILLIISMRYSSTGWGYCLQTNSYSLYAKLPPKKSGTSKKFNKDGQQSQDPRG